MALAATKKPKVRVRRPEDLERIGIVAIEGMLPMMGILSGILRSFRFQAVNVLGNSDEAWARINGEPRMKADIVLIDWNAHPLSGENFVRQLRRVDSPTESSEPISRAGLVVDRERFRVTRDGEEVRLTPKEFDLLSLLAHNHDRVLSHRTILKAVWGPNAVEQPEHLWTLVAQLRKKIESDPGSPKYLLSEPWVGYRFVTETS